MPVAAQITDSSDDGRSTDFEILFRER